MFDGTGTFTCSFGRYSQGNNDGAYENYRFFSIYDALTFFDRGFKSKRSRIKQTILKICFLGNPFIHMRECKKGKEQFEND